MVRETSQHLERSSRRVAVRSSISAWLVRRARPRMAMAGAVSACMMLGFGSSMALRELGVTLMWIRYPLSLAIAYVAFVVLLGRMARRAAHRVERDSRDLLQDSVRRQYRRNDERRLPSLDEFLDQWTEGVWDANSGNQDARAGAAVFVGLLSLTIVLVCVYFVVTAPVLIAHVMVEGALVTSLYRPSARGTDGRWLSVALEETGVAALIAGLCLLVLGSIFCAIAPPAADVAEVWQHLSKCR